MKNKLIIILIITIIFITGCVNETENKQAFQSKIIENNSSYNIENYNKIKKTGIDFELALLDEHINIQSISFEIGQYADNNYNTIVYTINSDINITLKFDKNENLMLVNIYCFESYNNDEYDNIEFATLRWNYFNFDTSQVTEIYSLENDTIYIKNFEIDNSSLGLTISDTRYQK